MGLTRNAALLLCIAYRDYLNRFIAGDEPAVARKFDGWEAWGSAQFPQWSEIDLAIALMELKGALDITVREGLAFELSPLALSDMDGRFKRNPARVEEYIAKTF